MTTPPMPSHLDDYYQERISELDEEIYRLRDELAHIRMDLSDSEAFNEQLSRELADLKLVAAVAHPAEPPTST